MTQPIHKTSPVTIGLDVGDRTTHYCAIQDREAVGRGVCLTKPESLDRALADYPGARIALEAGSQSAWMSRHLA